MKTKGFILALLGMQDKKNCAKINENVKVRYMGDWSYGNQRDELSCAKGRNE